MYEVVIEEASNQYEAIQRLKEEVESLIEIGYKCQGGFSITVDKENELYIVTQAMVK